MKKVVALILCFVMVFSASSVAFAVEPVDQEHNEVLMDIQGGKLYAVADGLKTVAILTNDEEHLLDVSITYSDQPKTSYQWVLTDYPETFDYTQASFWSGVIENVNSRLSEANVYHITETVCDEPVETYSLDSSTGADFKEQMEDLLGTAEYYDRQKYMTSYQGKSFRVYDNMQFRIENKTLKSWRSAMPVSSLITGILGLAITQPLIAAICGTLSIVASAATMLPDTGGIYTYRCRAMNYRYVTMEMGTYPYNVTDKYIDYKGFEDADLNSTARAYIAKDAPEVSYTVSEEYFDNYLQQVKDAYAMYQQTGDLG